MYTVQYRPVYVAIQQRLLCTTYTDIHCMTVLCTCTRYRHDYCIGTTQYSVCTTQIRTHRHPHTYCVCTTHIQHTPLCMYYTVGTAYHCTYSTHHCVCTTHIPLPHHCVCTTHIPLCVYAYH